MKKGTILTVGVVAAVAALAGCSSAETPSGGGGTADGDLTGVELTIFGWGQDDEVAAFEERVAAFNDATGAEAKFVPQPFDQYDAVLQASLSSGDGPDVMYVDSSKVKTYVNADILSPVPGDALETPDDFVSSLTEAFTVDGSQYAVAKDFATLALFYDAGALEAAGVEVPATWDDLTEATAALTTTDQVGLVVSPEYARLGAFMQQAGGELLDGETLDIDTDANREALGFVQSLYDSGTTRTPAQIDAAWEGEAFGTGRAALAISGNWLVGVMADQYADVDYGVATLPAGPASGGNFVFSAGLGVNAASPQQEAAWAFVNFFTDPEGSAAWTAGSPYMPPRESSGAEWVSANPDLAAFFDGAEGAATYSLPEGFGEVEKAFNDALAQLADGESSPDAVIERVGEAGNAFAQ